MFFSTFVSLCFLVYYFFFSKTISYLENQNLNGRSLNVKHFWCYFFIKHIYSGMNYLFWLLILRAKVILLTTMSVRPSVRTSVQHNVCLSKHQSLLGVLFQDLITIGHRLCIHLRSCSTLTPSLLLSVYYCR